MKTRDPQQRAQPARPRPGSDQPRGRERYSPAHPRKRISKPRNTASERKAREDPERWDGIFA